LPLLFWIRNDFELSLKSQDGTSKSCIGLHGSPWLHLLTLALQPTSIFNKINDVQFNWMVFFANWPAVNRSGAESISWRELFRNFVYFHGSLFSVPLLSFSFSAVAVVKCQVLSRMAIYYV
jgi:hypothetical protein